jgi:hypothetical protein
MKSESQYAKMHAGFFRSFGMTASAFAVNDVNNVQCRCQQRQQCQYCPQSMQSTLSMPSMPSNMHRRQAAWRKPNMKLRLL